MSYDDKISTYKCTNINLENVLLICVNCTIDKDILLLLERYFPIPMYLSLFRFVLCCFIGNVLAVHIEFKDEENLPNVFQALVQRLEEHERRIQALENVDRELRREINKLNVVAREKDSCVLRLKTLLMRQNERLHSSGNFAFNEQLEKNVSNFLDHIVHSRENNLKELRIPATQTLQRGKIGPRLSISSNTGKYVSSNEFTAHKF